MATIHSIRERNPRVDLYGQRFGKLTVRGWAGNSRWICRCDCGGEAFVLTANLRRGNTSSCGCIKRVGASKRATTHGLSNTPAYRTWLSIRRRCHGNGGHGYDDYGAKGITVCDAWRESVEAFVRDVGQPPSLDHTLDRIDNFRGYEPGNVRWATSKQQARNKRNNVRMEFQGHEFSCIPEFLEWLLPQLTVHRMDGAAKRSSFRRELQRRLAQKD